MVNKLTTCGVIHLNVHPVGGCGTSNLMVSSANSTGKGEPDRMIFKFVQSSSLRRKSCSSQYK